ncbi:mitochondrial amino-acid acetyltransferase [Massarina eburnea CBS 473.64]|uniref:Amino-acid acetyltransferase, mitochondrial n=1 Tax=Massarina eburnea CBS 473.64 TaxID=1395130 RepID=A0A6A6RQW9_9PLEO|nr:mitochondrial amino-acid acetyltransferase [Massarina eburnea CBS 473.64]
MFSCCKAQSRGLRRATLNTTNDVYSKNQGTILSRFSTKSTYASGIESGRKSVAKERQRAERDQLTRLLKESPGKRDARNFLKHFDSPAPKPTRTDAARAREFPKEAVEQAHHNEWRLTQTGVNLGNLYEPTKAVQNNPVWTQQELPQKAPREKDLEPLHLALVKLRQPQALDDKTLGGIALTLSQMAKLGLNIAVVVDCDEHVQPDKVKLNPTWEAAVREQVARVADALEEFNEPGAFGVDHALCCTDIDTEVPTTVQVRGSVEVKHNHLLFPPIEDGIIPIIPPFAYDSQLRKVRVHADEVLLALTREFGGITSHSTEGQPHVLDDSLYSKEYARSGRPVLDRIIVLDPLGGIPSADRADGAHVFINLEAEFSDVRNELQNAFTVTKPSEVIPWRHIKNLDVVHQALRVLPPSSSALIITPDEAAISSQAALIERKTTGVRTRRSKNPLIHNLLTDKSMTSASLPAPLVTRHLGRKAPNPATFLKKGIPVTMIPDPRVTGPWRPPSPSDPSIELENDPRINFPRLVELIEDSFRRKLDARHYLDRIRGRIAGIIIAGDYEGGAICTWEKPTTLSTSPPPNSPLWVPYLDKFAVLTSSQGSGGVADIVWGALTRSAFPKGVVWRSRKNNPVNKWYFERSVGMWNLPDGYWTMFWTSEGVADEWMEKRRSGGEGNGEGEVTRWNAYVDVCAGVKPSWSDKKTPD